MAQLDKSQLEFCGAPPGNIRLLAPAGCGKTLSLLSRCKQLAEYVHPRRQRFLIVTFTRAAQQELASRLYEDNELSMIRDSVEVTTLNSWGFRRLRSVAFNPKLINSSAQYHFAMLNQLQSVWRNHEDVRQAIQARRNTTPRSLMRVIDTLKAMGFDHLRHTDYEIFAAQWATLSAQGLGHQLKAASDELVRLGVLESPTNVDGNDVAESSVRTIYVSFYKFWIAATKRLIEDATFTFEDQKYIAYLDERKNVESGRLLSGAASYDHIFVDEFQDINPLDLALIKAIAERNRATITIAGDDDQAIFEWRGATPEYILDPQSFLGGRFNTFTLGVNYRSPANIVRHSQNLIAHNVRRVQKNTEAASSINADIVIKETSDLTESLELVHDVVKDTIERGVSPSRVAVIGRKRSQIIPYQVYFASKGVSFCAAEDLQVFLSETFERILSLLDIKARSYSRTTTSKVISDILELCELVSRFPLSRNDRESLRRHLRVQNPNSLLEANTTLREYEGDLKGKNKDRKTSLAFADSVMTFMEATSVSGGNKCLGNLEQIECEF